MIDCNITKNYIHERKRMCEDMKKINCQCCGFYNRIEGCIEKSIEEADAKRAIRIVQNWSDRNPPKTLLTEFLERYPKTELNSDGFPSNIVPCNLGLIERKDICKNMCLYYYDKGHPCYDCWNTPINENLNNKE